ncbi:hypothetical protein ASC77_15550 [Nocardioides sp. Root1257]|uniref:DUF6518 family protein n=1 Tax=unclassified Nocardioides TaxID=2615069 RepID=UPI0006F682D9|nr:MULTISPECIES: DUF6518 family protein [unclassified Nocardioides]KQW47836.1 hypothetical protein ASC77_15550 [Nocardioides sp. Root1257]KRC45088.1 hypothetical protein ASE24_16500 [Nocardioides sp. Root224]
MSTHHAPSPVLSPARPAAPSYVGPSTPVVLAVAVAVGLALGVVDLWWSTSHPSAWSSVANSCAGWAACAFALGAVLRVDTLRAAVAAVVMLAVAVEAYYAAEVVLWGSDRWILTSPVATEWLVLAGISGAIYGAAGAWAAGGSWVRAVVGLAVGVSLLLGDAWQLVGRDGVGGGVGGEPRVLVLLALVMLAASLRRPWVTIPALVLSLPLSLVVAAAFVSTGVSI